MHNGARCNRCANKAYLQGWFYVVLAEPIRKPKLSEENRAVIIIQHYVEHRFIISTDKKFYLLEPLY